MTKCTWHIFQFAFTGTRQYNIYKKQYNIYKVNQVSFSRGNLCLTRPSIFFNKVKYVFIYGQHKRNRRRMKPFWSIPLSLWLLRLRLRFLLCRQWKPAFIFQLKSINDLMSFLVLTNDLLKDHILINTFMYIHGKKYQRYNPNRKMTSVTSRKKRNGKL